MKLIPPLPEPSLDEIKEVAINQLTYEATRSIEEMYPLSVIRDVVLGRMGEKETAQLREDYEKTIAKVDSALSDAKGLINKATDAESTRKVAYRFGDLLRVATVNDSDLTVTEQTIKKV